MKNALGIFIFLVFSATCPAQNNQSLTIDHIFEVLIGDFDNFEQEKSLPDSISRQPARAGLWLNPLCLVHLPVEVPAIGEHVLFLEWREGSFDGPLNRQRLWAFRTLDSGEPGMDFYSFKPGAEISMAAVKSGGLAGLHPEDLVTYPEGCTLLWRRVEDRYTAYLDPKTCLVTGQISGKEMSLEAVIEVENSGFYYFEKGVFSTGEPVFTVPGFDKYRFVKRD